MIVLLIVIAICAYLGWSRAPWLAPFGIFACTGPIMLLQVRDMVRATTSDILLGVTLFLVVHYAAYGTARLAARLLSPGGGLGIMPLASIGWPREHMLGLIIAGVIGAAVGLAFGYFTYAAGSGADGAYSFNRWLRYDFWDSGIYWGLFGVLVGSGIAYTAHLIR